MKTKFYVFVFFFSVGIIGSAQTEQQYVPLSKKEKALINSGAEQEMFRVIQTTEPEELKILKSVSADIDPKDPLINLLAARMYQSVMNPKNRGVGIAAPQIGLNRNVIWVMRFDKDGEPFELMINPKIIWKSELLRKGKEGCLSIPDIYDDVFRHYTIRIQYYDRDNVFHDEIIEGFTAVILQHETDHLFGILFTDRLEEQAKTHYHAISGEVNFYLEQKRKRN